MGIENLLSLISTYNFKDKEKIIKAYEFASRAHSGVFRKSGEPYIIHPLSVAIIAAEMHADADTICACLLHDCIEDVIGINEKVIKDNFNESIAFLVEGVTKVDKILYNDMKKLADEATMKKMIEHMFKDIRIIIVKLADRLHNMRTLNYHKREKQIEISKETMEIYVPLAELIGAYKIKLELEDICFSYLNEEKYREIVFLEKELLKINRSELDTVICSIAQVLNGENIPFDMEVNMKNIYGLYKRLLSNENDPMKVHDLFQIKYIVNDEKTCFYLNEIINKFYKSLKEKGKDYITNPKTNMYQALHSSVYVNPSTIFQFQIVTSSMDSLNTYGLTAYWRNMKNLNPADEMQHNFKDLPIYQVISEIINTSETVDDFNDHIRNDVLKEKVYVKTPFNETIELPVGATPIDFAYKIHTDLGNYYIAAKVNGYYVSPNYELRSKDVVEIISKKVPDNEVNDYSEFCITTHAKKCIKELIKKKNKSQ